MKAIIIDNIDFDLNLDELLRKLHMDEDSDDYETILEFIEKAKEIGRPKVIYKEAFIENKTEDEVLVDDINFKSRLLSSNLKDVTRVFPYVCTCGSELQAWLNSLDDMIEQYWVDKIMELALASAIKAFDRHIKENYNIASTSNMNPGSLEDWPIGQQRELFALLGDPFEDVGVRLTDSFLMMPIKSVSGIRYVSDRGFVNCELCPRENCPSRRAPYNHEKYLNRFN